MVSDASPEPSLTLALCEYAVVHSDETFSVVRGGIDFWRLASVPAQVTFHALLLVPAGALELGDHVLAFRLTTASGATTWVGNGNATVKDSRFGLRGTVQVEAIIDAFGVATFEATCEGVRGSTSIDFRKAAT